MFARRCLTTTSNRNPAPPPPKKYIHTHRKKKEREKTTEFRMWQCFLVVLMFSFTFNRLYSLVYSFIKKSLLPLCEVVCFHHSSYNALLWIIHPVQFTYHNEIRGLLTLHGISMWELQVDTFLCHLQPITFGDCIEFCLIFFYTKCEYTSEGKLVITVTVSVSVFELPLHAK